MNERRQQNKFWPLGTPRNYTLAKALTMPRLQANEVIYNVAVQGASLGPDYSFLLPTAAFTSVKDFHSSIDELRSVIAPWQQFKIEDPDDPSKDTVQYWKRDTLAVLQEILENTEIANHCKWAPVRSFNAENERVYTDLFDSNWWWKVQVYQSFCRCLPRGIERYIVGQSQKILHDHSHYNLLR